MHHLTSMAVHSFQVLCQLCLGSDLAVRSLATVSAHLFHHSRTTAPATHDLRCLLHVKRLPQFARTF